MALLAGLPLGLGTYRFILAALVLDSHAQGILFKNLRPLNAGVWAVAGFFVLSGFVMRRHAETLSPSQFYLDRFLRIYPHFLLFYALSFVVVYIAAGPNVDWLAPAPNAPAIGANLLVFPIAFSNPWLFGQPGKWLQSASLIPQAWSLGVEVSYYLILPVIARAPRLREAAFWTSLAVFALSAFNVIHTGWGYVWLPGTLWMFLLGWRLHDVSPATVRYLGLAGLSVLALALIPWFQRSPAIVVASGSLVAAWVITHLATVAADRRDALLGSMSYSLFLCHFIPIFIGAPYLLVAAVALCLAYIGAHLEMRIADIRRHIRSRRDLTHAQKAVGGAAV